MEITNNTPSRDIKTYNQQYYLKNREKILEKRKSERLQNINKNKKIKNKKKIETKKEIYSENDFVLNLN